MRRREFVAGVRQPADVWMDEQEARMIAGMGQEIGHRSVQARFVHHTVTR